MGNEDGTPPTGTAACGCLIRLCQPVLLLPILKSFLPQRTKRQTGRVHSREYEWLVKKYALHVVSDWYIRNNHFPHRRHTDGCA